MIGGIAGQAGVVQQICKSQSIDGESTSPRVDHEYWQFMYQYGRTTFDDQPTEDQTRSEASCLEVSLALASLAKSNG